MLGSTLAALALPIAPDRIPRIGLQLYTVRDLMQSDVARTVEQVARIGYRELEFAGYFGLTPARIRGLLDRLGLSAPSSHVSLADLTDRAESTFDAAEEMGHRYLVVPGLDLEMPGLEGYRRAAAALNRAGELARERDLRVGYHNHDGELRPIGGVRPYDVLLETTDPALVDFEMDFYWMIRGRADPVAYFRRYPGRFHLCHLKDMDRFGDMTEVGAGRIIFRRFLQMRNEAGLRHFYVEHDHPADPLSSIAASYRFLRDLDV